jgi:hypothetical protein
MKNVFLSFFSIPFYLNIVCKNIVCEVGLIQTNFDFPTKIVDFKEALLIASISNKQSLNNFNTTTYC